MVIYLETQAFKRQLNEVTRVSPNLRWLLSLWEKRERGQTHPEGQPWKQRSCRLQAKERASAATTSATHLAFGLPTSRNMRKISFSCFSHPAWGTSLLQPHSRSSPVAQMVKNMLAMRETQVRSLGQEDALEKGKATWRIPWAEEPGGRQPMGLQRVEHDGTTNIQSRLIQPPFWNLLLPGFQLHIFPLERILSSAHLTCRWFLSVDVLSHPIVSVQQMSPTLRF